MLEAIVRYPTGGRNSSDTGQDMTSTMASGILGLARVMYERVVFCKGHILWLA
jgi:hypothetical protein